MALLAGAAEEPVLRSPVTLQYLERRKQAQVASAQNVRARHDFLFTNRLAESGIRFRHGIVDDAGKNYQAAHYDHGGGVAVADVDGDGRSDVYFTTQLGRNQLWKNLGGGRFEEITAAAGVGMEDQISVGAAFGDYDNDGRPDLFVTTVRHGNRLFHNEGGGRFNEVSRAAGVDHVGHSSGAIFLDFDRDGRLDLWVCNVGAYTTEVRGSGGYFRAHVDAFAGHLFPERTEYPLLYQNLGDGRFRNVAAAMKVQQPGWVGDATFTDLNQDGFPDLYLPNMQGDDRYYENQQGRSFLERTGDFFPKTSWGATGAGFFDYNQDGLPDLFVTDMHSDMTRQQTEAAGSFRPDIEKRKSEAYCSVQFTDAYLQGASNNIFGNTFYQNLGGGRFQEISDAVGAETYWPWGFSVGDLNADGFPDVFVTAGMGYPFRYAINSVLLNEGGTRFFDSEFLVGVEPRANGRLGKEFFTLDCSGADRTNALCAGKTGRVSIPGSLSSRSSVIFDLDDDGDLDVVTLEFNDGPQVLINDLAQRRPLRYLKVQLQGRGSNRAGLGARVIVRAGGRDWSQFHDGKSGYLAQSSMPLYFGLAGVDRVESVVIHWPSGVRQTVPQPAINRVLTVVESAP